MARDRKWVWGICLCVLGLLILPVHADLISPAITHVYFEKDEAPYNGSVQYSVNCYGYFMGYPYVAKSPGSYQPELIFHYSATCPGYGCEIYQPYYIHGHSDWCELEGQTNTGSFSIDNFSAYPYTRCDFVPERVSKTWGNQTEYYYDTPEFRACRQFQDNFYREIRIEQFSLSSLPPVNRTFTIPLQGMTLYEVPPGNTSTINKSSISMNLDQYIEYLDTCLPDTDANCPGWTVNTTPLKFFTAYRTLKNNATDMQQYPCDTFLIKADPSLIMPFTDTNPWKHPCADACNYTYEFCESRFTIPSGNQTPRMEQNISPVKTIPWTIMDKTYTPQPHTTPANASPSPQSTLHVHRSPVESLYCGIVEFFGGRCD